jgi:hypothetical protein
MITYLQIYLAMLAIHNIVVKYILLIWGVFIILANYFKWTYCV